MNPLDPQRSGHFDMLVHIIDKKNLSGLDRGPLDGLLEDLDSWFFETYLVG